MGREGAQAGQDSDQHLLLVPLGPNRDEQGTVVLPHERDVAVVVPEPLDEHAGAVVGAMLGVGAECHPSHQGLVGELELHRRLDRPAPLRHQLVQAHGLLRRARVPVQQEPVPELGHHELLDDLVGDEAAPRHHVPHAVGVDSVLDGSAKELAGGHVGEVELLREQLALGPLPGRRRPEQHDPLDPDPRPG